MVGDAPVDAIAEYERRGVAELLVELRGRAPRQTGQPRELQRFPDLESVARPKREQTAGSEASADGLIRSGENDHVLPLAIGRYERARGDSEARRVAEEL